jgi:hypothetical protein
MIKYIVLGALLSLNFSSKAVAQADFNAQRNAYENLKNDLNEQWISHKTIQEKGWDKYKEQIRQKWSDGIMPSVKSYVDTGIMIKQDSESTTRKVLFTLKLFQNKNYQN